MQAWEEKILDKEDGRQEGRQEGIRIGEERGLQKGKLAEKRATAKKMLAKGYPLEEIAELTGLSEHEIAELQKL